jgi:RimJ/RimL family protein N-acetyltransferase
MHALTAWAHWDGGLARLWLKIDPGNTASLELARRASLRATVYMPASLVF